jgi:hypothetical protein
MRLDNDRDAFAQSHSIARHGDTQPHRSSLMSIRAILGAPLTPFRPGTPSSTHMSPTLRDRGSFDPDIIRRGTVTIKEQGEFSSSWTLWRTKWMVLRERTITIYKSEVRALLLCVAPLTPPSVLPRADAGHLPL